MASWVSRMFGGAATNTDKLADAQAKLDETVLDRLALAHLADYAMDAEAEEGLKTRLNAVFLVLKGGGYEADLQKLLDHEGGTFEKRNIGCIVGEMERMGAPPSSSFTNQILSNLASIEQGRSAPIHNSGR